MFIFFYYGSEWSSESFSSLVKLNKRILKIEYKKILGTNTDKGPTMAKGSTMAKGPTRTRDQLGQGTNKDKGTAMVRDQLW